MNPLLGISLKVLSAFAFTLMSAGLKIVSDRYPTGQIVFFRSFFALIPLLAWLSWQGSLIHAIRTNNVTGHFVRGFIGTVGMALSFSALYYLPLHDTIAIGYAAPLMVVILAAVFLKEKVRAYRWTAVAVGFVGVMIMLSPYLGQSALSGDLMAASSIGAGLALMAAFTSAGAAIQVRRLTQTEKTGAIVFYFSVMSAFFGLLTIVLGWKMPPLDDFLLFLATGILGGIGQILMTQSYRHADASIIAPFEYTTMIWAILFGWFLFGDLPGWTVVAGAIIVAAAGLFVVWRERQLGLIRVKEMAASAQQRSSG
ncbi:DMT family transporter [Microvirga pudoricolor]|uniref:DMT family transporter n=1 Tax=Microvirga pudoricolor TaxID=2778729 RepID=UPI00194F5D3F|nr:DMT family transporter [Microvirga pudoricolor]MBM6594494.1 DMT family transporter [Microvirga pudoricolor]